MVNHCANPHCCKPLHYLRDGRIYMFEVPDSAATVRPGANLAHRTEHFWLCGSCSEIFLLEQTPDLGIKITPKPMRHRHAPSPAALAS